MAKNDIPNGFTGFSRRKPGFVSASDQMKRQAREVTEVNHNRVIPRPFSYARDEKRDQPVEVVPFDPKELSGISEIDQRWAWVEVDLDAIRHNVFEARRAIKNGCKLCAVVKADAYGHGAVTVAKTALSAGADYLAVATVPEALELRENHIDAPLMVLAQPPVTSIPLLLTYKIIPTLYDAHFAIQYAEAADVHGMRAPYHLAINTGMNRIGVDYDKVVSFLSTISFHRALDLVGTFTHFATADGSETFDFQIQARRFVETINAMRQAGVNPGIVHAANSAAIFRYPEVHFDMVRLGISLYGYHPCPETYGIANLQPAMSVHARVTDERIVPMSEGVSYGLNYRSPGSIKICTVPLGYADGLVRALSGATHFIYNGQLFRQVGNICMDQCMFEVDLRHYGTNIRQQPSVGDEILIVGQSGNVAITIDELAVQLGTIQHELTIGFSKRLPRLYRSGGSAVFL